MKKLNGTVVVVVCSVLALAGCDQLKEAKKAAEALKAAASSVAEGKGVPAAGAAEDVDARTGEKLSEYINCLNYVSKRVIDSRNRYLSWVNEKTGPTGKERNIYGLYELNPDSCYTSIEKAQKLSPPLPEIDAAATEYKKALDELVPLVKTANKYYDQDDYKDDKMAKGKELHAPLMAAFAKFEQVNRGFEDRVTQLNDEVGARQLLALEKDPNRRLQYLAEKSLVEAKKLIKLTDVGELKELDPAKYDFALQSYDKSLTELEQYAEQHKAEADKVMMFSSLLSAEREFLKSAKELMRRKRDNKDFNKEFFSRSSPQMVDGHPAQIIERYNRMINSSNGLRY